MKKTISILCVLLLVFGSGFSSPVVDSGTAGTSPTANTSSSADSNHVTRYTTAATATYNSAELTFIGSGLSILRRAYRYPEKPDLITVTTSYQSPIVEQEVYLTVVDGVQYGYNSFIDFSAFGDGSYQVEIQYFDATFVHTLLKVEVVKSQGSCYFPKRNSAVKQYNYDALMRLENGQSPNDFQTLTAEYGQGDNGKILNHIQAKALELTKACTNDRQKVFAIQRWISENIAYDMDLSGNQYYKYIEEHPNEAVRLDNPLNAFTQGYALCYGYAKLTTLMMGYAGVDCAYITGRLTEPNENKNAILKSALSEDMMNHAWNAVEVAGAWHYIDTCQDAVKYYYRTNQSQASTGYTAYSRPPGFLHVFPSLDYLSQTHIALRIGVKSGGKKLSATEIPDGWQHAADGVSRYYINGEAVRDSWKRIEGQRCYFDSAGVLAKGWKFVENAWRYFDENGILVTGTRTIKEGGKDVVYTFDANGSLEANNTWITFAGATRYFRGRDMVTGFQFIDGAWYYFDETGAMYNNDKKPLILEGKEYNFASDGTMK